MFTDRFTARLSGFAKALLVETPACSSCQKAKAPLCCGVCQSALCKKCAVFLGEDSLSFRKEITPELAHGTYCGGCFDAKVQSALEVYTETMERAKDVNIFFKTQGKETRFIKRVEKALKVENCEDRAEAILRLAFLAAEHGFNTLIDVEVSSKKIHMGGWQTSSYSVQGVPTSLDEAELKRKFVQAPN